MRGIYKIQSKIKPEKLYIGSSCNIRKRFNTHKRDLKLNKHHSIILQRHYNKYGEEDLEYAIVEECDNLVEKEQYYLDNLNPIFNVCKVAGRPPKIIYTEEIRQKMRVKKLGKSPVNKGVKSNKPAWNTGKKMPEEQRIRLLGHKVTEKTRIKISDSKKGKKQSIESVEKRRLCLFIGVVKLDKDGNFLEEYGSIQEAAIKNNIPRTAISRCIRGELRHYKNVKWKYKKEGFSNTQVI